MITRRYPVWISPRFFCALSLTEECFFYSSKAPTLFTIDTTLSTYMPTYVATLMPETAGGLCRLCDGVNILFIDFLPLFRHLTLSMSDAAGDNGGVFYTPKQMLFSESISKCKNSRYVLNK